MTRKKAVSAPKSKSGRSRRPDTTPRALPTTGFRIGAIFDCVGKVVALAMTLKLVMNGYTPAIALIAVLVGMMVLTALSFRYTRKWLLIRLIAGVVLTGWWVYLLSFQFQPAFVGHVAIDLTMVLLCALALRRVKQFEAQSLEGAEEAF